MAIRELMLINNALEDMRAHDLSEGFLSFSYDNGNIEISWHPIPQTPPLQQKFIYNLNVYDNDLFIRGDLYISDTINATPENILSRINMAISLRRLLSLNG